jgi:hypothetical protein
LDGLVSGVLADQLHGHSLILVVEHYGYNLAGGVLADSLPGHGSIETNINKQVFFNPVNGKDCTKLQTVEAAFPPGVTGWDCGWNVGPLYSIQYYWTVKL